MLVSLTGDMDNWTVVWEYYYACYGVSKGIMEWTGDLVCWKVGVVSLKQF